jgi:hypothetical protein
MKYKLLIAFIALSICAFAQTKDDKNNISVGFGTQSYNGALGNSWFNFQYETYGVFTLNYNRYLTKAFDVSAYSTYGDFGRCKGSYDQQQWSEGRPVLNMDSRLTTGNIALKYKLANGSILDEDSRIAPYIFLGGGINNASDIWDRGNTLRRVNEGNYFTVNGGLGLCIKITAKLNFTYNISFSYFTSDKIDYNPMGVNPMNMQNTYSLGYNF